MQRVETGHNYCNPNWEELFQCCSYQEWGQGFYLTLPLFCRLMPMDKYLSNLTLMGIIHRIALRHVMN